MTAVSNRSCLHFSEPGYEEAMKICHGYALGDFHIQLLFFGKGTQRFDARMRISEGGAKHGSS